MDIRENAVKVYRDTALAWFCVIFLVSMLALVIYLVFTSDLSTWGYVVFGVAFIATVSYFFDIRKNRNTIVVYPESLQIEHAQRMKNDFEGDDVGTVEIEWSEIKEFSSEYTRFEIYNCYKIELQNGKSYRFTVLEPAEFFLNRQLKKYHKQYK